MHHLNRQNLPTFLAGAIILIALLVLVLHGHSQLSWSLPGWELPYVGCSPWCS